MFFWIVSWIQIWLARRRGCWRACVPQHRHASTPCPSILRRRCLYRRRSFLRCFRLGMRLGCRRRRFHLILRRRRSRSFRPLFRHLFSPFGFFARVRFKTILYQSDIIMIILRHQLKIIIPPQFSAFTLAQREVCAPHRLLSPSLSSSWQRPCWRSKGQQQRQQQQQQQQYIKWPSQCCFYKNWPSFPQILKEKLKNWSLHTH